MQKPYHVASGRATRQPEPGQGRPPGRHRAGPGQLPGRPGTPRGGPEWTRHRSREPRRPLAGWPGGGWREGQVQKRGGGGGGGGEGGRAPASAAEPLALAPERLEAAA
ncbi:unnamed protein product, partial [Prorocentrum cordatum]